MTPTGFEVTVCFPFKLRVLPNMHVGPFEKARVVKEARRVVGLELLSRALEFRRAWRVMESNPRLRLRVLQERTGPQELDDDNLTGSFKPVRDEVAAFFGIDDGSPRWVWLPCKQLIGDYQVRIHLSVVVTYDDYPNPKEQNAIIRRIKKSRITPNVRKPR